MNLDSDKRNIFKRSMSLKLSPMLFRRKSLVDEIEEECNDVDKGLRRLQLVKNPTCTITPTATPKVIWDIFILLLILYSVTFLPYNIFSQSSSADSDFWVLFDSLIDFFFIIDMFLLAITSFYDKKNNIVTNWKVVLIKYLKTWLVFDIIINFPYQLIQERFSNLALKYCRFLKVLRIHRISKKLDQFFSLLNKFTEFSHLSENLIMWFIVLCLFIHVTACLWVSIPINENSYNSWTIYYKINDSSNALQYLASMYWVSTTIFTVGFGDILPVTQTEIIFAIFTMGFGVFFFSYIISNTSIILNLSAKRNYHLELNLRKLQMLKKKYKIPSSLYNKVEKHIKYNLENTRKDHKIFASNLSARLSQQLIFIMHKKVVDDNLFFQDKPEAFIRSIVLYLMPIKIDFNEMIFEIGDVACEMYFIVSGVVEYYSKAGGIEVIEKGDYFGDAEIFHREYRDFNVRALTKCEFLVLDQLVLLKCISQFEDVKITVITIALEKWSLLKKKEKNLRAKKMVYENVESVEVKKYPTKMESNETD